MLNYADCAREGHCNVCPDYLMDMSGSWLTFCHSVRLSLCGFLHNQTYIFFRGKKKRDHKDCNVPGVLDLVQHILCVNKTKTPKQNRGCSKEYKGRQRGLRSNRSNPGRPWITKVQTK